MIRILAALWFAVLLASPAATAAPKSCSPMEFAVPFTAGREAADASASGDIEAAAALTIMCADPAPAVRIVQFGATSRLTETRLANVRSQLVASDFNPETIAAETCPSTSARSGVYVRIYYQRDKQPTAPASECAQP